MDQQNIDRLFREKLDSLEVAPSQGAWNQVEKQIQTRKSPAFYWVAASLSLILFSWLIWLNQEQVDGSYIAGEVDHPVTKRLPDFSVPAASTSEKNKELKEVAPTSKRLVNTKKTQTQHPSNEGQVEAKENVDLSEDTELVTMVAREEIQQLILSDTVPSQNERETTSVVKITYIASLDREFADQSEQKEDSTKTLQRIIAFASKIDPGEMLADIKTAKDNLLNGGSKNKKERSLMIP